MRDKASRILLCAILLIGLLAALVLCAFRSVLELKNNRVSVLMTAEAATMLDALPEQVQLFDGALLWEGSVLLVEDKNQYSYVPDESINALVEQSALGAGKNSLPCVRCFHLTEEYAARYNTLGYPGAEEIENMLYRAVTDRNIRVIWLEPMVDAQSGQTVTNGEIYAEMLESLSARIARHGLVLDARASLFPAYEPNTLLLLLTAFGAVAAGVLLLRAAFSLPEKWIIPLLVIGCAASGAALLLVWETAILLLSFASSVIFPCLAFRYAEKRMEAAQSGTLGKALCACAGALCASFLIALAGGFFVGAAQSSTEWLLAVRNFRGVKLASILPLLFAAYLVLRRLCTPRELWRGKRYILIFALVIVAAAAAVFLLRTGDGMLSVSTLEQRMRNALERQLLVRPRSKEFLAAWPCFGLAFALCARGARRWACPFAILSTIGFSSVVNTFCHSRAPIWLSTLRGIYGLLPGLALALVLAALFHKAQAHENR
ncbi:MAG: hypothetical protein IKK00_07495 [Oscillospiraceae bacterium]|nr:hypothetical protein [Oscillospiraceae bacterium]